MADDGLLRRWLGRAARPIVDRAASRAAEQVRAGMPPAPPSEAQPLTLLLTMAARALAASGQFHVSLPTDTARPKHHPRELKVGLFGNIANNAYNFVRCLRRAGYDAELVVEDGWFDAFVMNRPFWEDIAADCDSYEEALSFEPSWTSPHYVRRVAYDIDLQMRYQNRLSAVPEVQDLYQAAFGLALAPDRALLLAQHMGHWPYLLAMQRYDVVQFSGAPISLAAFSPRPFVVFPTGSDLWVSPFEESIFGLLVRSGYRGAGAVLACEPAYAGHLRRLERGTFSAAPMMIDTDRYAPGDGGGTRERWQAQSGGRRFLLGACRQTWRWKGNDRLLRGFARFVTEGGRDWRLVLQSWGEDVQKSRALVGELGLEPFVIWEPLCSKPQLRAKQQAADAAADQFVVAGGYGTSVLEAMAAGKPVVMRAPPPELVSHLPSPPPFVAASDPESIAAALHLLSDDARRDASGRAHLDWVHRVHGYRAVMPVYVSGLATAAGLE